MSEHTAEEIAEVLDRAHDEMLVRGWAQGKGMDDQGRVCFYGALSAAITGNPLADMNELSNKIRSHICHVVGMGPAAWNDAEGRTIDEVLDLFRVVAKRLRNGEIML